MPELPTGTVTLLFSDIEGSTQLLRLLGDGYATVLADHHRLMRDAFAAYQGYEVDTQGDAFFVAFARASDTLRAAVKAQRALATYSWSAGVRVRVRMGLHTGQPLLTEGRYIGLDVHHAARIAAAAHGGQVLLSQVTAGLVHEQLGEGLGLLSMGEHALKDFERPEQLFQLLVAGLPDQFPPLRTQKPPVEKLTMTAPGPLLVGRVREFELLRAKLDTALAYQGNIVLLAGEAGIGKTRLAEEIATEARQRGAQVLWGRCWESEGAPAFWPWTQILRGLVEDRQPLVLRAELGAGAALMAELVPEVRERLPDLPATPLMESEGARFRLFDAVTTFLRNVCRSQPLVLILDDLHWADKPSLLLLQFLLQHLGDARLLLLGTYRDVEVDRGHPLAEVLPALRRERAFERVLLAGLSAEAVGDLATTFLTQPLEASGHELVRALWQETEGNPFFVQEMLRHLVESGRLVQQGERSTSVAWSAAKLGLPEGVQEVIGRRLARLSEASNELLTLAAVVGREFDAGTLERLGGVREEAVDAALDGAEAAHIIEAISGAAARYRFSHALIREALYAELPSRRRKRLHVQVGEALEERYGGDPEAHLGELAYHFLQGLPGGDAAKALAYARRAGEQALVTFAYEDAVRYFDQALQAQDGLDPDDKATRCDLLLALANALPQAGEPHRASEEVAEQALALAEALRDRQRASRACRIATEALRRYGSASVARTPEYRRWAERGDRYAAPGTSDRVFADLAVANVHATAGDRGEALAWYRRALELARELSAPTVLARAGALALGYSATSEPEEALRLAEEFSIWSGEGAGAAEYGRLLWNCARPLLIWGRREEAEVLWGRVREIAARTRDPHLLVLGLLGDGVLARLDGRLEEAVEAGAHLIARGDELGMTAYARGVAAYPTESALLYLGRGEESLARWRETRRSSGRMEQALTDLIREARVLAYLGRRAEARTAIQALLEREHGWQAPNMLLTLEAAVLIEDREVAALLLPRFTYLASLSTYDLTPLCPARLLGDASVLLGDREAARAYYEQVLEVAGKIRFRPEIALTRLQLAELLLKDADEAQRAEALGHLDFAIGELREMKMQRALERALRHKEVLKA